ncbi:MAG: hypothetical protein V2A63_03130 [Patescibacteria group bacterium]
MSLLIKNGLEIVKDPFIGKDGRKLVIAVLRNHAKFGDVMIARLASSYRDIYGHGEPVDKASWSEYLRCQGCQKTRSIEDFYRLTKYQPIEDLEKDGPPENIPCPSCEGKMELFWDPKQLVTKIRNQVQKICLSIICDPNGERIEGFEYGWVDTLESAWQETIGELYHSDGSRMDYSEFLRQMVERSQGKIQPGNQFFHLVEAGMRPAVREHFFAMFGAFMNATAPHEMIASGHGITATQKDSSAAKILQRAGWEITCGDPDSKIIVCSGPLDVPTAASLTGNRRDYAKHCRENVKK